MFSSSELQSIFIAAKHINTLRFSWCKLDVADEFDISQETFHIEELELPCWRDDSRWYNDWSYDSRWNNGWRDASRWNNNIEWLEILVKAVANSSLKHSLNTIHISERWEDIEYKVKVTEIFERHDLRDVLKLEELSLNFDFLY